MIRTITLGSFFTRCNHIGQSQEWNANSDDSDMRGLHVVLVLRVGNNNPMAITSFPSFLLWGKMSVMCTTCIMNSKFYYRPLCNMNNFWLLCTVSMWQTRSVCDEHNQCIIFGMRTVNRSDNRDVQTEFETELTLKITTG